MDKTTRLEKLQIAEDIGIAETMPSSFYTEDCYFEYGKTAIFHASWSLVLDIELPSLTSNVAPAILHPGYADEEVILVRQEDRVDVLSNVCTHRASLILHEKGRHQKLICPYHGRRFSLSGACEHMPEFKLVEGFPCEADHLKRYKSTCWYQFLFVANQPRFDIDRVLEKMHARIGFLELDQFIYHEASSKTHQVNAHWALYCDNYLEGFHIPFVHPGLNEVIDYGSYETMLDDEIILQVGYARDNESYFNLPADHIDAGKKVGAYYYFIFPNLMLNFYPWGLSINIVEPKRKDYTEVRFITYVYDQEKFDAGASEMTDKVEEEDEAIVEAVQRGMRSSAYQRGRYSPTREQGVHHFHRLIAAYLSDCS